jgi:hypothetical protein
MTFVAVTVLALVATSPWWGVHRAARQRVLRLASVPARKGASPGAPGASGASVGLGGGGRAEEPARTRVEVPVLLELVAAAIRAGAGVPRALEAVGDAVGGADGRSLRVVASGLRLGSDWDAAWVDAAGATDLDPLRRALRGAWADGAAPGEALRAAGQELLQERRAAARTAAARLGVRLVVPLGVCFLPAFVLLGLAPVLLSLGVDLLSG